MSTSDIFATTNPRLRNLMRQYSGYLKQNNINLENFNLSQSSHPAAQMYNLTQTNDLLLNQQYRRGSDVRSLIQQLMTNKQIKNVGRVNINSARPVLVNTEQRIFQQVINLLLQINEIKQAIEKQKQLTIQMQAERDSILNKGGINNNKSKKPNDIEMQSFINRLKSKQNDQLKVSVAQLQKISAENQQLQKNINRLRIKSKGNLKQVLQNQKQRYNNLKKRLQQKNGQPLDFSPNILSGSSPEIIQQIRRLQADIGRLEAGIQDGNGIQSQIRRLSAQNQRLKEKTIQIMNQQGRNSQQSLQEAEQKRRLQEYIEKEKINKQLFFEDLKKFKEQYNALRQQNEELKRRLKGSQPGSRAQKYTSERQDQNDSRFIKYQDLMSEINTMMK